MTRKVAVLGLFRGGTSCTAGVLHHLGLYLGSELLAPNGHNVRGYFEPAEFSTILRRLCDEPALIQVASSAERVECFVAGRNWKAPLLTPSIASLASNIRCCVYSDLTFCKHSVQG